MSLQPTPITHILQDIGEGLWADSLMECEEECTYAEPDCNALAFLSEPLNSGLSNCYLKKFAPDTCALPADAEYWPRATFSMRRCDPAAAAAAADAAANAAEGPDSSPLGQGLLTKLLWAVAYEQVRASQFHYFLDLYIFIYWEFVGTLAV